MKGGKKGFTLIELMIALAIIALISGSMFTMFTTSSKLNRRAKEIDKANLLAVSEAEKIKKNPKDFVSKVNAVTEDAGNNSTITTATLEKYYDYNWNETDNEGAVFTASITVLNAESLGEFTTYRPKHNENDNYVLCKTKTHNLIVAIDQEGASNDYKVYILEYSYEEFINDLLEKELAKQDNDGYGYTDALKKVLSTYGVEYKKDTGESGNLGAIPIYLKVKEHVNTDEYNIDVYNLSKKQIDLYSENNGALKGKINWRIIAGTVNLTDLGSDRNTQSGYNINVKITRNKDGLKIVDYSTQKDIND